MRGAAGGAAPLRVHSAPQICGRTDEARGPGLRPQNLATRRTPQEAAIVRRNFCVQPCFSGWLAFPSSPSLLPAAMNALAIRKNQLKNKTAKFVSSVKCHGGAFLGTGGGAGVMHAVPQLMSVVQGYLATIEKTRS
jgi:hypothetical protein